MPAFQPLSAKRKPDYEEESARKRPAFGINSSSRAEEYWMVQWQVDADNSVVRNPQTRKHKTWDGDAILVANTSKATLYDVDGKALGVGKVTSWPLEEGKAFSVAGKDIELDRQLTRNEYFSGQAFGSPSLAPATQLVALPKAETKQFVRLKINPSISKPLSHTSKPATPLQPVDPISVSDNGLKPVGEDTHWTANWRKPQQKKHQTWDGDAYISLTNGRLVMMSEEGKLTVERRSPVPWLSYYDWGQASATDVSVGDKTVAGDDSPGPVTQADKFAEQVSKFVAPTSFYGTPIKRKPKGPLHDPDEENAVVMKAPTKEHIKKFNKKDLPVVAVVIDPVLSRRLRPHQCEEQNPYATSTPVVEKVLIVCPVSLVNVSVFLAIVYIEVLKQFRIGKRSFTNGWGGIV
ncbi:hypothetical protein DXG01_015152, partial [Tephrocybe rancida]